MTEKWEPQDGEVVGRDADGNPTDILVKSDSSPDPYAVRWITQGIVNEETDEESFVQTWVCSCKAYEYGGGKPCKHIKRTVPERLIVDLTAETGR